MSHDPEYYLVVDDVDIAHRVGAVRRTHLGHKRMEPVLSATTPYEQDEDDRRVYIYGTVLSDPQTKQLQMWYMRYPDRVLYATSKDGIKWHRPQLNLMAAKEKQAHNVLPIDLHSASLIYDARHKNSPYRMFGHARQPNKKGYCVAHSSDGLHWKWMAQNPVLPGGDTCTLSLDPVTGDYLAFHKRTHEHREHKRRLVYLSTSADFQTWSEPTLVMAPDAIDDAQTLAEGGLFSQFYNMSAFPCGNQWLGFVTHFRYSGAPATQGPGQSSDDGPIDVQLVHSRDGRFWSRCEDRNPVIANGPHKYDAGCILGVANAPVQVGDEHWVYYTAITTTHGGHLPQKQISIARATWQQTRWCSLEARSDEGIVETVPLSPVGDDLLVNVDAANGQLTVEICNQDGQPLPNYRAEDCIPISTNEVAQPIRWKQTDRLPTLRPICLRFSMHNAQLFSYRFVRS